MSNFAGGIQSLGIALKRYLITSNSILLSLVSCKVCINLNCIKSYQLISVFFHAWKCIISGIVYQILFWHFLKKPPLIFFLNLWLKFFFKRKIVRFFLNNLGAIVFCPPPSFTGPAGRDHKKDMLKGFIRFLSYEGVWTLFFLS